MAAKYDRQGAFTGYEPTGKVLAIVKGDPEALEAMRDRMAGAFAPPTEDEASLWLAELDVIAPRRAAKAVDDDLRLRAYLTRAAAYPADVVREAMLVRRWSWFPSWAELAEACDELVAHRAAVLAELDRQVAAARERELRGNALPSPEAATLTPEEAAARKDQRSRALGDLLADLTAKAAEQDAADAARTAALNDRNIAAE